MDWKRIGRLLVCLVLVVCLLVNISPIQARAVSPGWMWVTAAVVIPAILRGIGIDLMEEASGMMAESAYDLITDCQDFLTLNYDHISDDEKILVWATANPDMPYMVQQELVEDIRGWLFDDSSGSSVLNFGAVGSILIPANFTFTLDTYRFVDYPVRAFCGYVSSSITKVFLISDYRFNVTNSSGNKFLANDAGNGLYYVDIYGNNGSSVGITQIVPYSQLKGLSISDLVAGFWYGTFTGNECSTDLDLNLDYVSDPSLSFDAGYTDWSAGSSSVPSSVAGTNDDVPVVPIGIGNTPEETAGISQSGQWSGASTYVDTSTDTDTGTDTESGSGTGTGTGSGSTSVTVDMSGVITGLEDQTAQIGLDIGNAVAELIASIPVAIKQALIDVFVPAEDYISVKVDALRAKFPFIDSVIATGEFIRDSVSGASGPPAIYVDLGLATSGNYGSQKVLLTDFAWYSKYKPTVDTLLSSALWAFFGWRVFLKLPGIISGESGYIGEVAAHKEKMDKIRSGPPGKR